MNLSEISAVAVDLRTNLPLNLTEEEFQMRMVTQCPSLVEEFGKNSLVVAFRTALQYHGLDFKPGRFSKNGCQVRGYLVRHLPSPS